MPIWSLTLERLEKLKSMIAAKKAEHDELDALSEKDLWCNDLDEFEAEWEAQLKLDVARAFYAAALSDRLVTIAESTTNLRRLSVSDAVMELDMTGATVLCFQHDGSGRVNVIYRRSDGNIGWIDPPAVVQQGH